MINTNNYFVDNRVSGSSVVKYTRTANGISVSRVFIYSSQGKTLKDIFHNNATVASAIIDHIKDVSGVHFDNSNTRIREDVKYV